MGSYAPVPWLGADEVEDLLERVHRPVLAELASRGAPFVGCLYAGLMLTADGPKVLEFNCRLGDPETQSVLPLVAGDLLAAFAAAAAGDLPAAPVGTLPGAAVTVVLAAAGYPAESDQGSEISGIAEAEAAGALVFQARTALHGRRLTTNGGRILGVVGRGPTVADAREQAYAAGDLISFAGARRRDDIALAAASGPATRPPPSPPLESDR
jgi:phosphoribosylamine--glycine ligase